MKALHIALILFLAVAALAAYVIFRPAAPQPEPRPAMRIEAAEEIEPPAAPPAKAVAAFDPREPVPPLEDRGDAMLFEIEALQNTPFDKAIVAPLD